MIFNMPNMKHKSSKRRKLRSSVPHSGQPNDALVYQGDGRVCSITQGLIALRALPTGDKVIKMEQVVPFYASFSSSTTSTTGRVYSFQLSDMGQSAALSTAFDQYRILGVEVLISPRELSNTELLDMTSAIDFDGFSGTPTAAIIQDYSTCMTCSTNQQMLRKFRPAWANSVYGSSTTTNYSHGPADQWLDMQYTGIPHYGLILFIGITPAVYDFRVDVKYTFEVRLLR
jgi:hypothetical protein